MKSFKLKPISFLFIGIILLINLNCEKDNPIDADNTLPEVAITNLALNASYLFGDTITFTATATDAEDGELDDSSLVWASSIDGLFGTGSSCQIDSLSINTHLIILIATDSDGAFGADTATVTIRPNGFPEVSISEPTDTPMIHYGDTVLFVGSGSDSEDGTLMGDDLVWTSDIDGLIGTGDTLVTDGLSINDHVITLTATDNDNNIATANITIEVILTFEKTYGGYLWDDAKSICPTPDGGFIMAGGTLNGIYGNYDVYVIKVDSLGEFVWENAYGGSNFDWGYSISEAYGGYVISGYIGMPSGYPDNDLYLIKIDYNGNKIWERTFGGSNKDVGYSVCETSDGGYMVAGCSSRENYVADIYLVKTNINGETVWEKTYGVEEENEVGNSVLETSDGGFIVTGYKQDAGGYTDLYIFKTDDTGGVVWESSFGGATSDVGNSISKTSDGGYIITGYIDNYGSTYEDVWLLKVDNSGNLLWEKTFGGPRDDRGYSVRETADGGFIIGGYTMSSGAGDKDVYLIKTDNLGNLVWERTFGGEVRDWGNSVLQTDDGGYIIGGMSDSWGAGGYYDVYLIKTDAEGLVD